MYIVGTYIVSKLTGMRYVDFVDKRIFKPLGMTSSTYSINGAIQTGRFTGTWTSFGRYIPPWLEEGYVDLMAGAAGVISSVEDLVGQYLERIVFINNSCLKQALWNRMYLNGGVDPRTNTRIISTKNLDVITRGHSVESPATAEFSTMVYGAGWERVSVFGHDVSEGCPLYPISDIILAISSSRTQEPDQGFPRRSLPVSRMASGLSSS
jgi:CubicO group peptidase (beta-lactamase class C family)